MENQKTLILIDGHALAFRQYFALERTGMKTTDNQPTWAVFGFFKAVFDLLKNQDIKPDAITVAFDVGRKTFRVEKYDQYKANRETMPDTLRSQMGLIFEGLKAFNIPIYTKEGYEADDVIGTICDKATKLGHKTLILTGDQDSFQLVDKEGFVKVLIPSKGELIEYNWDKVYEKLGVYPNQVTDYKGLRGDTSDNIPGIRGIGEKTAQKLLSRYPNMEKMFAHCTEIPENAVREKICSGKDIGLLSKELATIVKDVDIDFDFQHTHIELPDISEVTEFLKKLQFYSFIRGIDGILSSFNKNKIEQDIRHPEFISGSNQQEQDGKMLKQVQHDAISKEKTVHPFTPTPIQSTCQMQLGLFAQEVKQKINKDDLGFEVKTITTKEDLKELVENLKKVELFALDTETTSVNIQEAELVGISVAYEDFKDAKMLRCVDALQNDSISPRLHASTPLVFYIPLSHQIGEQLELKEVLDVLKPVLEDKNIKKTLQNAKFDYNIFQNYGIKLQGVYFDTMLASYIKDPTRKHGLKTQSLEHLNHIMQEITELIGSGKNQISMECVSIEEAAAYACDDAYTTLQLTKFWQNNLDEKELKLLYDIEVPLAIILAQMEYDGVSVDMEYLNKLTAEFNSKIAELEEKIFEISGIPFNVNSPKQVGEVLFDRLGIAAKKKRGKSNYSTSAEILEELAKEHKICEYLLLHRQYSKLKSTYTDALPQLISKKDGRIHTSYNQTVTTTGRLSSSNPNLQNIPIRTEEGNKIRHAFVPQDKEKELLLSADYSQIELRLMAHISRDDNLIEAFCSGEDVHSKTAASVFEVPVEGVTKDMRYKAKAVNFGIVYGQSKYGLAKSLGIAPFAAEMFIEKYFATYPKVREYMQNTIKFAHEHGYVETMFGRKRYLQNDLISPNFAIREAAERAAINQPLQGTAADLIKMAMIELDKKLKENNLKSKMIMQVHDELVLEVEKDELDIVKKLTLEAMELNQPLLVPLVVDISYGKSWLEN
ncbi:MAG: DNA polymerase I [Candidatus Gastranaerophilales bacterium]|nr:DNA polymerase I [Candidatus Gastranaerophilales bacterium]